MLLKMMNKNSLRRINPSQALPKNIQLTNTLFFPRKLDTFV